MSSRRLRLVPVLGLFAPTVVACSDADTSATAATDTVTREGADTSSSTDEADAADGTDAADGADATDGIDGANATDGPDAVGGGDAGDDTQQSGQEDAVACEVPEVTTNPVVPRVMWVLDKSGSMAPSTWDHDLDSTTAPVSRWMSLHHALEAATPSFDAQVAFGAQLSPSSEATSAYNADACKVSESPEVAVTTANADALLAGIPAADSSAIAGGNPASAALEGAFAHLVAQDDGTPMAVIFVTDGAANCRAGANGGAELFESADLSVATLVGDALAKHAIPTYVVGIDVSDAMTATASDGVPNGIVPAELLNEIAVAGGRPLGNGFEFHQTRTEVELTAAFQTVLGEIRSCSLRLDPPPTSPDGVTITVDGEALARVTACATEDGWVPVAGDDAAGHVTLCESACAGLHASKAVAAEYACESN